MRRVKSLWALLLILSACNGVMNDPQKIIDKTIDNAGGIKYLKSTIEFDFRGRHYKAVRNDGLFSYERIFSENENTIHDYLTNDGFKREINNQIAKVADTMKTKYSSSVNSVVYFALLPYGLNDASVNKKLIGESIIDDKPCYKIKVTFSAEGGGEDYEDEFYYWIDKNDFSINYMAYSYEEGKGIGFRFRKAFNKRKVNGILFIDYINYKPKAEIDFTLIDEHYLKGELEKLSKIELENIQVNLN
jgi:hypothetical protein